jgi:hypothetical protein
MDTLEPLGLGVDGKQACIDPVEVGRGVARPLGDDRQLSPCPNSGDQAGMGRRDQDRVSRLRLDEAFVAGALDEGDLLDAVALRDRLAETPARVHRHEFWTISSPTGVLFASRLAVGRRPGAP